MGMQRQCAAVIVTYNRLEKLKDTLQKTFTEPFAAVVVVNNASTDGTRDWLDAQEEPRLHVIHSPENRGGAGGFNQGFDFAASQLGDCSWLVAFDDDAYPELGTLAAFNAIEIPDEVGGVAAAVHLPGGDISEMNRPSVNPFWHLGEFFKTAIKGRMGFHVGDEDYLGTQPKEIDASSFVGFFLRLSLIREGRIGLPRTELFIYTDDIIYVLEMRKAGVKHWFTPWLRFSHDCNTISDRAEVYRPLWKVYYTYRNRLEMYRIAAGWLFPAVLIAKIPKFFFAARHYYPQERRMFLKVTSRAVRDGVSRDFSCNHASVLSLAHNPSTMSFISQ